MRAPKAFVSACCLALLGIAAGGTPAAGDTQTQVLARDLDAARTPGKVAAVIWTVRTDHCTLQVVFPNANRIAQAMKDDPKLTKQHPRIQVWLLKADGSLIEPTQRAETDGKKLSGAEVLFAYPLSADKDAVAAAIQVDDAFYVEPMSSLSHD